MLKNKFAGFAIISLYLYAIVDFLGNVFETAFRVYLVSGEVNYSSADWVIDLEVCQQILLIVAVVCLTLSVLNDVVSIVQNRHGK